MEKKRNGDRNFCENSRVQVPAAIHLLRLGYTYIADPEPDLYDHDTNILLDVLRRSLLRLNPGRTPAEIDSHVSQLCRMAHNDDLGRQFYDALTTNSGIRVVDFLHPDRNEWHCTTEFTCRNDNTLDEFRPDLTLFLNGIPVAFIEVKKPNNHLGMLAEKERIESRMSRDCFRPFFNVTQLMLFSNNQEYDQQNITPIQGAFYATPARAYADAPGQPKHARCMFNVFREEDADLLAHCGYNPQPDPDQVQRILLHRHFRPKDIDPEYQTNLDPNSPTNRIITSLFSRERLLFMLRYGIANLRYNVENQRGGYFKSA